MTYYNALFKGCYRTNYPIAWGKDGKVIAWLKQNYSPEQIKFFLWCHIFACNDFVRQNGHNLAFLRRALTDYLPRWLAKQKSKESNPDYELLKAERELRRSTHKEPLDEFS